MKKLLILSLFSLITTLSGCFVSTDVPEDSASTSEKSSVLPHETLAGKTVKEIYASKCNVGVLNDRNFWVIYEDGTLQNMFGYYNDDACTHLAQDLTLPDKYASYSLESEEDGGTQIWTITKHSTYSTYARKIYLRTAVDSNNWRCFGEEEGINYYLIPTGTMDTITSISGHKNKEDIPDTVDFSTYDHCIQKIK